jgi:transcriptional regulator with XRE-family HTH domain
MSYVEDFGSFIRLHRRFNALTMYQMSRRIGISIGYYSDIEHGRRKPPDKDILDKIIIILQLSDKDKVIFNDLAIKAQIAANANLPEYVIETVGRETA